MIRRLTNPAIFMSQALIAAAGSTCSRRAVGCVLVDRFNFVIGVGRNGVPSKFPHCIDVPCPGAGAAPGTSLDKCLAVHAETNALLQCHDPMQIEECYTTSSPCIHCTKLLLNTSCKKIWYLVEYPHPDAKFLWLDAGRCWQQVQDHFVDSINLLITEAVWM